MTTYQTFGVSHARRRSGRSHAARGFQVCRVADDVDGGRRWEWWLLVHLCTRQRVAGSCVRRKENEEGGRGDIWRVRSALRESCVLLWLRQMTRCLFQT